MVGHLDETFGCRENICSPEPLEGPLCCVVIGVGVGGGVGGGGGGGGGAILYAGSDILTMIARLLRSAIVPSLSAARLGRYPSDPADPSDLYSATPVSIHGRSLFLGSSSTATHHTQKPNRHFSRLLLEAMRPMSWAPRTRFACARAATAYQSMAVDDTRS